MKIRILSINFTKKIETMSLGHRDNNPNFLFNFVNLVSNYELYPQIILVAQYFIL